MFDLVIILSDELSLVASGAMPSAKDIIKYGDKPVQVQKTYAYMV